MNVSVALQIPDYLCSLSHAVKNIKLGTIEQKSSFTFDSSANLLFNVYLSMLSRIACMSPAKRVGRLVAVAKSPWFQSGIVTSFTMFGRLLRKYSTSWKQERINMLMRFSFINILHHHLVDVKLTCIYWVYKFYESDIFSFLFSC